MTPSPSVGPGNPDNPSQHAPLPQRHEPHLRVERMSLAASLALADDGEIKADVVLQAIKKYGLDTERPDPWTV